MSSENSADEEVTNSEQINYLEDTIEVAQGHADDFEEVLEDHEDEVPDFVFEDYEGLDEHLERIEDLVDDAQDEGQPHHLVDAAVHLQFVQGTIDQLGKALEVSAAEDVLDDLGQTAEDAEDRLDTLATGEQSIWYARVDQVPVIKESRFVEARDLITEVHDDTDYRLKGYVTETSSEPDFETGDPGKEVDLEDIWFFRTEAKDGGRA